MNETSIFTNRLTNVPLENKPALKVTADVSNDDNSYLKDNLQTAIEQSEIFEDFEVAESIQSGIVCDSSSKSSEKQEGSKEFVKETDLKSNTNTLPELSSETSEGNENIDESTTCSTLQATDSSDKFNQEEKNSDSEMEILQALHENNNETLQQTNVQKQKLNGIHNGEESITGTSNDKIETQISDCHNISSHIEDVSSTPRKQTSQLSASEVQEKNLPIKNSKKDSVLTPQGLKDDSASNDSASLSSFESTDNCSADGSNSSQEEDDRNLKENISCQDIDSPVNEEEMENISCQDIDSPINEEEMKNISCQDIDSPVNEEEMEKHARLVKRIASGVQDQVVSSSEFLPARFSALQESDIESDSIISINNEDLVSHYNKADANSNSGSSVIESEENTSNESSSSSITVISDSENTESSKEKSSISDSDDKTDTGHKDDSIDKLPSLQKHENLELKKITNDNVIEDDIHQITNENSENEHRPNDNNESMAAEVEKDQDMKSVSSASDSDYDMFEDNDEVMKNISDDELTKSKIGDQLTNKPDDELTKSEIGDQLINNPNEDICSNISEIDKSTLSEVSPDENLLSNESQISTKVNEEKIDPLLPVSDKNIENLTNNKPFQSTTNESREDESNNPQSSSSSKNEKGDESNREFDDALSSSNIKSNKDIKDIMDSNLISNAESVLCTAKTEKNELVSQVIKTENLKLDDMKCTSNEVCHKDNRNDITVCNSNLDKSSEEHSDSKIHSIKSEDEIELSETTKQVEKMPNKCDKKINENLSSRSVKYHLKACKVNLSDSKISESVILDASRDLLLDKRNFCKLKRKLEDMLQTTQLEDEKFTQQLKKMREEKSLMLKDIVFQIKNVKKKYSI